MSAVIEQRSLGGSGLAVTRLGIGLAAVARPGYINLGRDQDLPGERSPDALYERCSEILDAARALGVGYVDVARSYGRAEEFLARWLEQSGAADVTIGSKWGYRYTADWQVEAEVHEQKELSQVRFSEQLAESRQLLGDRIDLYQIHSATVESGVLEDDALLHAMCAARGEGKVGRLGLTLSGPRSAETLERALDLECDGARVFDAVQATCNLLEPSLLPLLQRAAGAGVGVIAKEVHANGRLTPANRLVMDRGVKIRLGRIAAAHGLEIDQLAVAFVASHPWVDIVNSGAATVDQLRSHAAGVSTTLPQEALELVSGFAETPAGYWKKRSGLPWS